MCVFGNFLDEVVASLSCLDGIEGSNIEAARKISISEPR